MIMLPNKCCLLSTALHGKGRKRGMMSSLHQSCHFHCSSTRRFDFSAQCCWQFGRGGASKVLGCGRRLHGFYQSSSTRVDSGAPLLRPHSQPQQPPARDHFAKSPPVGTFLRFLCIFYCQKNSHLHNPSKLWPVP